MFLTYFICISYHTQLNNTHMNAGLPANLTVLNVQCRIYAKNTLYITVVFKSCIL